VTNNVVVVFQDCANLMEIVPGSHSEPCHEEHQFIHVNVEDVIGIKEEMEVEDPLAITYPVIETEDEVSFMSVSIIRHISHISSVACLGSVPYMSSTWNACGF
jgi:hypothetical protein